MKGKKAKKKAKKGILFLRSKGENEKMGAFYRSQHTKPCHLKKKDIWKKGGGERRILKGKKGKKTRQKGDFIFKE